MAEVDTIRTGPRGLLCTPHSSECQDLSFGCMCRELEQQIYQSQNIKKMTAFGLGDKWGMRDIQSRVGAAPDGMAEPGVSATTAE